MGKLYFLVGVEDAEMGMAVAARKAAAAAIGERERTQGHAALTSERSMERVDMEVSRKIDLGFWGSFAEARRTTERRKSTRRVITVSMQFP